MITGTSFDDVFGSDSDKDSAPALTQAELEDFRANAKQAAKELPVASPGLFVSLCKMLRENGYTTRAQQLFAERIKVEVIPALVARTTIQELYLQVRIQCNKRYLE
jgi:hypothetical protein